MMEIIYGELERIGEETVVAYFKTLSQHSLGRTEEKQSG
jgi:hypothetical protein